MKYILIILSFIAFASCKKSSDAMTPPANTAAKITVQSAVLTDHSGTQMLDVTLKFENSSTVSSCQLVIYQDGIAGTNYKYDILVKDGLQVISCSHWGVSSPMTCQIKYTMKSGAVEFTTPFSQTYN